MADSLRDTLIRVYSMDMRHNHGNVSVAEILHRRVTYTPLGTTGVHDTRGAVLIDGPASLGPIGQAIGSGYGMLVMIRATDELLWVPTRAEMNIAEYWTIEMVPWVEYLRAASITDEEVIRRAHQ